MVPLNYSRKQLGATFTLVIALIAVLFFLGSAFLYLSQIVCGDKELISATDAGALAAARQIAAVTLTPSQVNQLPQEFTGLGVDANGTICPSGEDSNGNPALFNVNAYNNCAAYTLEIAFNAADNGSNQSITSASTLLQALNTFAQQLDQNIQASTNISGVASTLMSSNPLNCLPGKLFNKSQTSPTLVPNSLQFAYYAPANATANVCFPTTFSSKDANITSWVNKVLSTTSSNNNGPNLIAGGKAFDLNQITGNSGFVDSDGNDLVIALIPFQSNQSTHLVSSSSGDYHSPSLPAPMTNVSLPHTALQLLGESNSGTNGGSGTNNLNLTVLSAAVLNTPSQYVAYIPSTSSSNNNNNGTTTSTTTTTTTTTTGGCAYVAIINGGDYQASLNAAGLSASYLQGCNFGDTGYSNVDLSPSTNIAFNDSYTDIFDILAWDAQESFQDYGYTGDWIVVGTDSTTGMYNIYQSQGVSGFTAQAMSGQQNFPASNYNDVVDNTGSNANNPSIPFVFMGDYCQMDPNTTEVYTPGNIQTIANTNPLYVSPATVQQCMADFGQWIVYNTSSGSDALGKNPNVDPLGPGGSPTLYTQNPNSILQNTSIAATSTCFQQMTIADALKIRDVCVFHDGQWVFTGSEPSWMDNLMSVIASNYGYDYLPTPIGEYKPNGYTGIEYAKEQVIAMHAGDGLSEANPKIPSNPGPLYLPGGWLPNLGYTKNVNVTSGLRYFVPFDTNGNFAHYVWPEPPGCPKFETPGTPLQLLQNIDIFDNNGTFNANDQAYTNLLNTILSVVQQMNASITMNDLTTVLNSNTIDLGQTFYLIYDSTQQSNHGLEMVSTLPAGATYQPADGNSASATCTTTYPITSQPADLTSSYKTLVDSAAAPNSMILYNGKTVCPAPYGDCQLHVAPYNVVDGQVAATDTAVFWPSSGANNNHGEVLLSEFVSGYFQCIAPN